MALDQNSMTFQKMTMSMAQLIEQLKVTQSTKKDMSIEDVIKALNTVFKTSKGDTTELKALMKIAKNSPNAKHFEKLGKMLELLIKSYNNPDVKQMKRLDITVQNLMTEISSLTDSMKNSNASKNEKANLSVLSQAVSEGHRLYAVTGMGKISSEFYKNATLEQLRLLKMVDKSIKDGRPLKDTDKGGIAGAIDKMKKMGLFTAAADTALKGMGFGTLPGEFLEIFGKSKKDKDEELTKKQELQSLKVQGLVDTKEKAQRSIDSNKLTQTNAEGIKEQVTATRDNLTVELSKAIANAMQAAEGGVDARFQVDGKEGEADIDKIAKAISNNEFPKSELESIIKSKYLTTNDNGEQDSSVSDALLQNMNDVEEYNKIIAEQEKVIADSASAIQTSIESTAKIFLDLREILGNELKNEINELNKIIDKNFKGESEETRNAIKDVKRADLITRTMETSNVTEDEVLGLIGGESKSGYMKDYAEQGARIKGATSNESVTEAFQENTMRSALGQDEIKSPEKRNAEILEKLSESEKRMAEVKVPTDLETKPSNEAPPEVNSDGNPVIGGDGISLDEMAAIITDSMNEFIKRFNETIAQQEKESSKDLSEMTKALTDGRVKVVVTNLGDIKIPPAQAGGGNTEPQSGNERFGG